MAYDKNTTSKADADSFDFRDNASFSIVIEDNIIDFMPTQDDSIDRHLSSIVVEDNIIGFLPHHDDKEEPMSYSIVVEDDVIGF